MMTNFVEMVLRDGGTIKPLILDSALTNGTALFNPSIWVENDRIYLNIRHCQYTLYHSELNIHEHPYGPLLYFNPEDDQTLTTTNYFGELNPDLTIKYCNRVDTSRFDQKPIWEFVGLEDARVIKWDDRIYLCGVRRDTTPNGQGRMELSEIEFDETSAREVSRWRIPAPGSDSTYCEKNWMPIVDMPWHFWKWSNPVEIVKVDKEAKTCNTVHLNREIYFEKDLRGNGQVIPFEGGYLTLTHEVQLFQSEAGRKNGIYTHRLTHWSKDFKPIAKSNDFSFLGAKIEFACGMAEYHNDILMTFGYQDNAAYVLRCPKNTVKGFMNA
jgi:hypothetical protein